MKSLHLIFDLLIGTAQAHGGGHAHEGNLWLAWTYSPAIILYLGLVSIVYTRGWFRLRSWRALRSQAGVRHIVLFYSSMMTLVIALLSPVDALSDSLAFVHMTQHMVLMMVSAPLFALASPFFISMWGLPSIVLNVIASIRRRFRETWNLFASLGRPLSSSILYGIILWIWHWPLLYEAALNDELVHDIQHLSFFIVALLFWKILFGPYSRKKLEPALGIVYLFVASMHSMILGVLMALSPVVWYPHYEQTAALYGFTPLEDQQIAGYIMWMPAGTSYFIAAVYLAWKLISGIENQSLKAPRT